MSGTAHGSPKDERSHGGIAEHRADVQTNAAPMPEFLNDGGEMGALMRSHDWSTSSLGHPASWARPLRTVVRVMLNSGHPMYVFWGADRACLYNDAYRRSIGPERHPGSLGRPALEVWLEIWDIIGPQIDSVMGGRGSTWHENHLVPITRNGKREDVYWTYSFSPDRRQLSTPWRGRRSCHLHGNHAGSPDPSTIR